jgi:hypothetical protein
MKFALTVAPWRLENIRIGETHGSDANNDDSGDSGDSVVGLARAENHVHFSTGSHFFFVFSINHTE